MLTTAEERLSGIYERKLVILAELKQSLLQKAFSGELTAKQAEDAAEGAAA
jgi:type I restriction enzyme S subunit